MPMIWADGADQYGSEAEASQIYSSFSASLVNNPALARTGNKAFNMSFNTAAIFILPSVKNQVTMGVGFRCDGGPSPFCIPFEIDSGANSLQLRCYVLPDFSIQLAIVDLSVGTPVVIGTSQPKLFGNGVYVWLEMQIDASGGAGANKVATIRLGTGGLVQPVLVVSGALGFTGFTQVTYVGSNLGHYLDDLVICADDLIFPGDRRCVSTMMTADTAQADWTKNGAATGFGCISNVPPDPAKFLSAAASPSTSDFLFPALPGSVGSILGMTMFCRSQKSDAGNASIQYGLKAGAGQNNGPQVTPPVGGYGTSAAVITTNPATGNAYAPAELNGARLSLSRTL